MRRKAQESLSAEVASLAHKLLTVQAAIFFHSLVQVHQRKKLTLTANATDSAIANESPVILRALGLEKSFGGKIVLDGVDVELRSGEVVLLDGENGSGKTTLLNILTGNIEADSGSIRYSVNLPVSEYHFPRSWLQKVSLFKRFSPDAVARQGFGRTWQDVRLFESLSLRNNIALGQPGQGGENPLFALLGFDNQVRADRALVACNSIEKAKKKAGLTPNRREGSNPSVTVPSVYSDQSPDEMLALLGLLGRGHSSGDMISLGQSKRVSIARAIYAGAKVIFLDEPLAGLDKTGIRDALDFLKSLVANHKITIVISEHAFNQIHLRDIVTTRWHLVNGKLTISVPAQKGTLANSKSEVPKWFQLLAMSADDIVTGMLPRGAKLTRFCINDRYKPNPALEIKNLVAGRGSRAVIGLDEQGKEEGFDLVVNQGEVAVLQAPNGWGKTTLLEAILNLAPFKGSVQVYEKRTPTKVKVGPKGNLNAVTSSLGFASLSPNECLRLSGTMLPCWINPNLLQSRNLSSMSGGQQKLVQLVSAVNTLRNQVLVMDEPFNGLDGDIAEKCLNWLIQLKSTILFLVPSIGE